MITLLHGRVELALHPLTEPGDAGPMAPLLLLHSLGSATSAWPDSIRRWPGEVYGLDFSGHGESGRVVGGGYHPEHFLAEADIALQYLRDRACIVGAGLGAYVALLLAGSRPDRVGGALLLDGHGLAGGPSTPDWETWPEPARRFDDRLARAQHRYAPPTDPFVFGCELDVRPDDYAAEFARAASALYFAPLEAPPDWWESARSAAKGEVAPAALEHALSRLSAHAQPGSLD